MKDELLKVKPKRLIQMKNNKLFILFFFSISLSSQIDQSKGSFEDKFRQLEEYYPTPNELRTASGSPGNDYWQQEVDYFIQVELDEKSRSISGELEITYKNNSPYTLNYVWLQLDQNRFKEDSIHRLTETFSRSERISFEQLREQNFLDDFSAGLKNLSVKVNNQDVETFNVGTLMRINLPMPLISNDEVKISVDWENMLLEENAVRARSGYETFQDGNDIFLLAQWYPRMVAFSDYEGWHNKEFIDNGEFTLEFGNFEVEITVPSDHIVAATGEIANANEVLSRKIRNRLREASKSDVPIFIVDPNEAYENELEKSNELKTWKFKADNVRDFAWASSRKFIWDAAGFQQDEKNHPIVMAMSFYPNEGEPLWSKYSTEAIMHTMEVYSKYSFPYRYPTAQSVNGAVGGMEYPMITFNGPRAELEDDGTRTYSRREKEYLIGVVIHEIGHIYFPMIVNSDERQWTWMDEGINTFLQYLAEQEWDLKYRSDRGEPRYIVDYMKSNYQVPIMTNSESILQFGNNAYAKPATALVILRESILGRELFDLAFREYANKWKFKRPTPYDFFRTMEEATGTDLDWFWRGWFYSTDHVDIALEKVFKASLDTLDPKKDLEKDRSDFYDEPLVIHDEKNLSAGVRQRVEERPQLLDIYDEYDEFTPSKREIRDYEDVLEDLYDRNDSDPEWRKKALIKALDKNENYYILEFNNLGGLVTPIPLQIIYEDGSEELVRIPAEIWRKNPRKSRWLKRTSKEVSSILVDPYWETGDVEIENNYYPSRLVPSRLKPITYRSNPKNLMRDLLERNKKISNHQDQD